MADANITKRALAAALKALMEEQSFEKISISDICERCHRNRKSFYYHFRDKYDLVNWIFDTEFQELMDVHALDVTNPAYSFEDRWHGMVVLCEYFYDNRNFYQKILKVEGQNSFASHFRDFLYPILQYRVQVLVGQGEVPQMVFDFIVDGLLCAIERWLLDKNCVTTEEFLGNLLKLVNLMLLDVGKRIEDDPRWLEEIREFS